jgi:hypothetical protein
VRSTTALAIARAGAALQLALDLVEVDPTLQPERVEQLLKLRHVATMLSDVPLPPPELEEEQPGPSAMARCDSCGQLRIIAGLSPKACPTCGLVSTVTAVGHHA